MSRLRYNARMISEFDMIRRYFTHAAPHAVLGVGDDAALIRPAPDKELAVSTDMLLAGTHFFPDADAYQLGHKALAVNLSDMAAMGATPRWVTLALALPAADEAWLGAFSRGFMELAAAFEVDLIGGDTTRGPLAVCVQIMGEVLAGQALRRSGAQPGDEIWVSGTLGDAALGLAALRGEIQLDEAELAACLPALHRPVPRVALGQALLGLAHSAIDVSDGLCADLGHILETSGVGAMIEFAVLPKSAVLQRHLAEPAALRALLAGGDDYELCFTAPRDARKTLLELSRKSGVTLTRIGRIEAGQGLRVLDFSGAPMQIAEGGFDHFH
ncbi:MAG: thiamine-phosphate kinase [Pseudomonadota bacterium]